MSVVLARRIWAAEKVSLDELMIRPAWQAEGLCRVFPDANWFPLRGESTAEAKRICLRCPVRAECLDYALTTRDKFGVWGGTSERERRHLRKVVSVSGREAAPAT